MMIRRLIECAILLALIVTMSACGTLHTMDI